MKKALTLMELLITIVMMSLIIPSVMKIYSAMNESSKFTLKEELLTPPLSWINYLKTVPWDENSSKSGQILLTDSKNPNLECDKISKVRIGSFSKERNCKDLLKASYPIKKSGENDSLNDYADKKIDFFKYHKKYSIKIDIFYVKEGNEIFSYDYTKKSALIDLSKISPAKKSSNLKEIKVTLSKEDKNITSFSYFSANLGSILIEGERW